MPPSALFLILRPGHPGFPGISKDDWLLHNGYDGHYELSNKDVSPLIKMGLLLEPFELGNVWKVTGLTEWGFELITRGRTSGPDNRSPGRSSTIAKYRRLMAGPPYALRLAIEAAGITIRDHQEDVSEETSWTFD